MPYKSKTRQGSKRLTRSNGRGSVLELGKKVFVFGWISIVFGPC